MASFSLIKYIISILTNFYNYIHSNHIFFKQKIKILENYNDDELAKAIIESKIYEDILYMSSINNIENVIKNTSGKKLRYLLENTKYDGYIISTEKEYLNSPNLEHVTIEIVEKELESTT